MSNITKQYSINEIFLSLQGEGIRQGTVNIFIRFAHCNLTCNLLKNGFDCDTEFSSFRALTIAEIIAECQSLSLNCEWIVLTGGEPALQVDSLLIEQLKEYGYKLAIETNGTKALPSGFDFITVSPKTAEHTLRQLKANEVKYVRHYGQGLPQPKVIADHYLISPAFGSEGLEVKTLEWCINLCLDNPNWRLSIQQHKLINIR